MSMFFERSVYPSLKVNFFSFYPFLSRLKIIHDLSFEDDISSFLSIEKSMDVIGSWWPSSSSTFTYELKSGLLNSYTLTIQSSPPAAISLLSLENLQQLKPGSTFLKSETNSNSFINLLDTINLHKGILGLEIDLVNRHLFGLASSKQVQTLTTINVRKKYIEGKFKVIGNSGASGLRVDGNFQYFLTQIFQLIHVYPVLNLIATPSSQEHIVPISSNLEGV